MSILDGWWREGYDGTNGFAIGEDSQPTMSRNRTAWTARTFTKR